MDKDNIFDDSARIGGFLKELVSRPEARDRFLADPAAARERSGLAEVGGLFDRSGVFYRFVKDDEAWGAVLARDSERLRSVIDAGYPEISESGERPGPNVWESILFFHHAIVAFESLVAAGSTVKVVATVSGQR